MGNPPVDENQGAALMPGHDRTSIVPEAASTK